jgi:hypothetical protein
LELELDRRESTSDVSADGFGVDPCTASQHTAIGHLLPKMHVWHQSYPERILKPA